MVLSPEPPKPRRRRGGDEVLIPDTSVPLLPDRRGEAQRVERCRRLLAREGSRLVRRITSGGFNIVDRQGIWTEELTLEEVEDQLGIPGTLF